jgi:hypothetical protein
LVEQQYSERNSKISETNTGIQEFSNSVYKRSMWIYFVYNGEHGVPRNSHTCSNTLSKFRKPLPPWPGSHCRYSASPMIAGSRPWPYELCKRL